MHDIDLSDWFRSANEHWRAVVGPMAAYLLICVAIFAALYLLSKIYIGYLGFLFVGPQLAAGPTIVCLAQLKGQPWTFRDFFGGFRSYRTWLNLELLVGLLQVISLLPGLVLLIIFAAFASRDVFHIDKAGVAWMVVGIVLLITIVLVGISIPIYVWFRASIFARQLVIDRGYGAVEAMKGSWALTRGYFWRLFGTYLLMAVVASLVSLLTCGVGAILIAPYGLIILTAIYQHRARTRATVPQADTLG